MDTNARSAMEGKIEGDCGPEEGKGDFIAPELWRGNNPEVRELRCYRNCA